VSKSFAEIAGVVAGQLFSLLQTAVLISDADEALVASRGVIDLLPQLKRGP
jgi:hypothetical protein